MIIMIFMLLARKGLSSMEKRESPYICHLFICTNSRDGERKSCGDAGAADLKGPLKDEIRSRGWKGIVRATNAGCLGVCDDGPNIMIYPQKIWLSGVTVDDIPEIIRMVEEIVENAV